MSVADCRRSRAIGAELRDDRANALEPPGDELVDALRAAAELVEAFS